MLVVDRIELVLVDQALKMRHLDGDHAFRRQEMRHAGDEIVELRHLRQHVVGDDQIGMPALGHDLSSQSLAEEGVERRDAAFRRLFRDIGGGLDAEDRHAEADEMLEQVTVIAAELDDEALGPKPEPLLDHPAVAAGMFHPSRREGREIGVLGEDVRRAHEFRELDQPAMMANPGVQRVIGLGLVELLLGEEALAERRHAEIDEGVLQRRAAMAASHRLLRPNSSGSSWLP